MSGNLLMTHADESDQSTPLAQRRLLLHSTADLKYEETGGLGPLTTQKLKYNSLVSLSEHSLNSKSGEDIIKSRSTLNQSS